jgi:hypothetical protein
LSLYISTFKKSGAKHPLLKIGAKHPLLKIGTKHPLLKKVEQNIYF